MNKRRVTLLTEWELLKWPQGPPRRAARPCLAGRARDRSAARVAAVEIVWLVYETRLPPG